MQTKEVYLLGFLHFGSVGSYILCVVANSVMTCHNVDSVHDNANYVCHDSNYVPQPFAMTRWPFEQATEFSCT